MKFLFLLIAAALAGAWFYPPYAEGTANGCAAFEKKLNVLVQAETKKLPQGMAVDPRVTGLMGLLNQAVQAANGLLADAYIRQNFPQLPPALGCVAAYWKITFDPDLSQYVKGRLPLPR
jgi:hypothetical protein